jgi:hypothetical protein
VDELGGAGLASVQAAMLIVHHPAPDTLLNLRVAELGSDGSSGAAAGGANAGRALNQP